MYDAEPSSTHSDPGPVLSNPESIKQIHYTNVKPVLDKEAFHNKSAPASSTLPTSKPKIRYIKVEESYPSGNFNMVPGKKKM